ncbi:MAG: hypothetical protein WCF65_03215 [Parachlamydiaceae bacterium]
MSLLDFIAFVFVFGATGLLFFKKKREAQKQSTTPQEHGKTLQEFFESLEADDEDERLQKPVPKHKKVSAAKVVAPVSKAKREVPSKPSEHYEVMRRASTSRGGSLIKTLKSPRDMLILKEIFDKPLSSRDHF